MTSIRPAPTGGKSDPASVVQIANTANSAVKRAQLCLPKDGSEAMTGKLNGKDAAFSGNETVGGTLTVTGATTLTGGATAGGNTVVTQTGTPTAGNLASWNANGVVQDAGVTANHAGRLAQAPVVTETGAVATGTTTFPGSNTTITNVHGDQYMSATITPTNASSTLLIFVTLFLTNTAGATLWASLCQDAIVNALAAGVDSPGAGNLGRINFVHKMAAGTTSATTFKVRAGASVAGTTTFNGAGGAQFGGGIFASSIVILEILP